VETTPAALVPRAGARLHQAGARRREHWSVRGCRACPALASPSVCRTLSV